MTSYLQPPKKQAAAFEFRFSLLQIVTEFTCGLPVVVKGERLCRLGVAPTNELHIVSVPCLFEFANE